MTISYTAIRSAIQNVILGLSGSVRTVDAGTFSVGQPRGAGSGKVLSLITPRFRVIVGRATPSPAIIPINASRGIRRIGVKVEFEYPLLTVVHVDERDATIDTIMRDMDTVCLALSWPGNLAQATSGIVSGVMLGPSGGVPEVSVVSEDWIKQMARVDISGVIDVVVTQTIRDALPTFLSGIYPVWHSSRTLPDGDGPVSTWIDASTGQFPLTQDTVNARPTRDGDVITFAVNDYVFTTDAALVAYPDARAAWCFWAVMELNASTPSAAETAFSWGHTVNISDYVYGVHQTNDKLVTIHQSTGGSVTNTSTADQTSTRALYIWQGTGGAATDTISSYKDNSLQSAASAGAIGSAASNRFAIGCLLRSSAALFSNASIVAAGALPRVMTGDERTALQSWFEDEGCPL